MGQVLFFDFLIGCIKINFNYFVTGDISLVVSYSLSIVNLFPVWKVKCKKKCDNKSCPNLAAFVPHCTRSEIYQVATAPFIFFATSAPTDSKHPSSDLHHVTSFLSIPMFIIHLSRDTNVHSTTRTTWNPASGGFLTVL